jgi:hypothetical protein
VQENRGAAAAEVNESLQCGKSSSSLPVAPVGWQLRVPCRAVQSVGVVAAVQQIRVLVSLLLLAQRVVSPVQIAYAVREHKEVPDDVRRVRARAHQNGNNTNQ